MILEGQCHVQLLGLLHTAAEALVGGVIQGADRPPVPLHGATHNPGWTHLQVGVHLVACHGRPASVVAIKARDLHRQADKFVLVGLAGVKDGSARSRTGDKITGKAWLRSDGASLGIAGHAMDVIILHLQRSGRLAGCPAKGAQTYKA